MKKSSIFLATVIFVATGCREQATPKGQAKLAPPPDGGPVAVAQPKDMPPSVQKLDDQMKKFKGYVRAAYDDPSLWVISFPDGSRGPNAAELAQLAPMLKEVDAAVSLSIENDSITDADLAHLKGVTCFRSLGITSPKVTDAGLAPLSGMTKLRHLYLVNANVTDAGMAHLSKLSQLRKLLIYTAKLSDAGLKHLAGLTALEQLHFGENEIADAWLVHMKGMTKLTELRISKKVTDEGMAHLKNMTGLRSFRIDGATLTAAGLANLAGMKNLEELTVLSGPDLRGKGLAALPELTKLKRVEIIYTGVDLAGARNIAAVKNLEHLRFGHANADAMEGIKDMANLKELDLNYSGLADDAAKHLSGLKSLQRLDLSNTRVSDAGIKHLQGLTNLEHLQLASTGITDEGLQYLAGMTKLKSLYLRDCKIKGPGLKHLSSLAELQDLGLAGTSVTDAGLTHLQKLSKLSDLNLTGTQVDDDAVLALKKALPRARICDASGDDVSLTKAAPPPARIVENLTKSKVDFAFTAEKYAAEFKAGRDAAKEKYKDKVIELTGVVIGVNSNISGDEFITLDTGSKEILSGIHCFTAAPQPWARHAPGQKVKLKGKQTNWSEATLMYCVILEASENPAIVMTAAELSREYAANPEATRKKYDGKIFLLSGEIAEKTLNSAGAAHIRLKTEGKVKVNCGMTAFEKKLSKALRPGRQVTMYGQFSSFQDGEVRLNFCLPVKKE